MNAVVALLVGVGGCDTIAWLASRYDGPFRLVAGLWLLVSAIWTWQKWFRGRIDVFSRARWGWGLVILSVVVFHPIIGGPPSFHSHWNGSALIYFVWCLGVIGFAEELWWRGVWFELWKGRPFVCVLIGSLAFTAYHFPFQGWDLMISEGLAIRIFSLGLLLAAARYYGRVSVGVLALVHGLIDWSLGIVEWQRQPSLILFAGCCIAFVIIIFALRRKEGFVAALLEAEG